jgi:hypothetical protein
MGGGGEAPKNKLEGSPGLEMLKNMPNKITDDRTMQALAAYGKGGMSLQDAIGSITDRSGQSKALNDQLRALQGQRGAIQAAADPGEWNDMMWMGQGGDFSKIDEARSKHQQQAQAYQAYKKQIADMDNQINSVSGQLNGMKEDSKFDRSRIHQLFTDPTTGSLAAAEQIRSNPLLSGLFGEGGMQDQLLMEQKNLAEKGFNLTDEDRTAYGEASDNTARLYGEQEGALANALAARGLSAAPSGAAAVAYSGLAGNKNEQLAAAQRKIADDRMTNNLARLDSVRNLALKSGTLATGALQDQFGRNLQGAQNYNNTLKDSQNAAMLEQGQENVRFESDQATQTNWGQLAGGILGAGVGALAGGVGTGVGASLGSSIGGALGGGGKAKVQPGG